MNIPYKIGTMIEVPRGALQVGKKGVDIKGVGDWDRIASFAWD